MCCRIGLDTLRDDLEKVSQQIWCNHLPVREISSYNAKYWENVPLQTQARLVFSMHETIEVMMLKPCMSNAAPWAAEGCSTHARKYSKWRLTTGFITWLAHQIQNNWSENMQSLSLQVSIHRVVLNKAASSGLTNKWKKSVACTCQTSQ